MLSFPKSSATASITSRGSNALGKGNAAFSSKPWKRLEQALKATDLLLHSGGWGVVIFDLGSIPWTDARRIELSTWFRFRRTIENTPTILVLLVEESCAKSCSSLVLHCQRNNEDWSHLNSARSILPELPPWMVFRSRGKFFLPAPAFSRWILLDGRRTLYGLIVSSFLSALVSPAFPLLYESGGRMVFGCIFIPDFSVQAVVRQGPDLCGKPVAILQGAPPLTKVFAANKAAKDLGVEVGMTKLQAECCGQMEWRWRSLSQEASAQAALFDCAYTVSPRIEQARNANERAFFDCVVLDLSGLRQAVRLSPENCQSLAKDGRRSGPRTEYCHRREPAGGRICCPRFFGNNADSFRKRSRLHRRPAIIFTHPTAGIARNPWTLGHPHLRRIRRTPGNRRNRTDWAGREEMATSLSRWRSYSAHTQRTPRSIRRMHGLGLSHRSSRTAAFRSVSAAGPAMHSASHARSCNNRTQSHIDPAAREPIQGWASSSHSHPGSPRARKRKQIHPQTPSIGFTSPPSQFSCYRCKSLGDSNAPAYKAARAISSHGPGTRSPGNHFSEDSKCRRRRPRWISCFAPIRIGHAPFGRTILFCLILR